MILRLIGPRIGVEDSGVDVRTLDDAEFAGVGELLGLSSWPERANLPRMPPADELSRARARSATGKGRGYPQQVGVSSAYRSMMSRHFAWSSRCFSPTVDTGTSTRPIPAAARSDSVAGSSSILPVISIA
jgi:hypothetical protein